ncbi:MAG: NAD(P)-dependent oxidoreductase [Alphaproteobacteria bacterium]|nr:NAD(P)-dependent oxidoreductase [Alphaproteobacteria bacterium]
MGFFKGKKVLVTGGTGMIGRPLVEMLLADGALVRIASLDDPALAPEGSSHMRVDLRQLDNCVAACDGIEHVFHLAGVKGSPAMTAKRPATFFVSNLMFSINMMEAARRCGVERYLFTSTVGVYSPAEIFREDDVWKTFPSPHDWFAGWAKRMGELQGQAYGIEYGWDKISIVRPANVYGPHDDFNSPNAMVVTALIKRAMSGENPLVVWGDGSAKRDFIHARDVARGMMLAVEKGVNEPINLGSGVGTSVREVVEMVIANLPVKPEVVWDTTKPTGDALRLMDMTRANGHGFAPIIPMAEGIRETMEWYAANRSETVSRYNAFTETVMQPKSKG